MQHVCKKITSGVKKKTVPKLHKLLSHVKLNILPVVFERLTKI